MKTYPYSVTGTEKQLNVCRIHTQHLVPKLTYIILRIRYISGDDITLVVSTNTVALAHGVLEEITLHEANDPAATLTAASEAMVEGGHSVMYDKECMGMEHQDKNDRTLVTIYS